MMIPRIDLSIYTEFFTVFYFKKGIYTEVFEVLLEEF